MPKRKSKEVFIQDKVWYRDNRDLGLIVMALPAYEVGTPVEVDENGKVLQFKSKVAGYQTWRVVADTGEVVESTASSFTLPAMFPTAEEAMADYWMTVGLRIQTLYGTAELGDESTGIQRLPDYGDGSGDELSEDAVSEAYAVEPAD